MRLLSWLLLAFLALDAWAEPGRPILGMATLNLLAELNWRPSESSGGDATVWRRGDSQLQLLYKQIDDPEETWRLGTQQAEVSFPDGQAVLSLPHRGWSLLLTPSTSHAQSREELLKLATTLSADGTVRQIFGHSVQGSPLEVVRLGTGPQHTLFLGVFHGDEPAGEYILQRLIEYLVKTPLLLAGQSVSICSVTNPDGLRARTRVNARSVDLNRNFPTSNWSDEGPGSRYWGGPEPASEPETRAVLALLEAIRPAKIVTLHAPLHNVNYDGPAATLAQRMSALNGYPVEPDIGYPTPGSFGTYTGRERKIPTITLEFPEAPPKALWHTNKEALLEALVYEP